MTTKAAKGVSISTCFGYLILVTTFVANGQSKYYLMLYIKYCRLLYSFMVNSIILHMYAGMFQ